MSSYPHTVEFISDRTETVQNILARIAARTSGATDYPKFEDLVRDQIEWCGANVRCGWSYDNASYQWTFRFERKEDAALFKLFWIGGS